MSSLFVRAELVSVGEHKEYSFVWLCSWLLRLALSGDATRLPNLRYCNRYSDKL